MPDKFWEQLSTQTYATEADVETRLVLPLLAALGYSRDSIASKPPLRCVSTRGRKPEADYVVFDGTAHDKDHALITIEVKKPGEKLDDAKLQAEFYAAWFKTPFLLLTNGEYLEIWILQLSRESQRVFASEVRLLDQGKLEFQLTPESVLQRCVSLNLKVPSVDDVSFGPYVDALVPRLDETLSGMTLDRDLLNASSRELVGSTEQLLNVTHAGCCVTGAAGYGKSTLQKQLAALALERLQLCLPDSRVPVMLDLPDLLALGEDLVEHARKRVAAHIPNLRTHGAFERVVLATGRLVLLLDAYDRVSEPDRPAVLAWMSAFESDYPRCRIVVFSRPAQVVPSWPEFQLRPFKESQVFELLGAHHDAGGAAGPAIATKLRTNPQWKQLVLWPYFFRKLLDYHERHQTLPATVSALMEEWLARMLSLRGLTRAATLKGTLKKIAHLSQGGPIDLQRPDVASVGDDVDELVDLGLLRSQGFSVELVHEMLGDYLRASEVSLLAEDDAMAGLLRDLGFDRDGGVLLFIAERLDSWDLQRSFWSSLVALDLRTYLKTLRTASPGWPRDPSEEARLEFLAELRRGYSELAERGFPRYARPRGIVGYVPKDYSEVAHRAVAGVETAELTSLERVQDEVPFQRHSLSSPHVSVSTPRKLGTDRLIKDIRADLDDGFLDGGTIWRQERVLMFMSSLDQGDETPLAELHDELRRRPFDGSSELQDDVRALLEEGHETGSAWSLPGRDLDPGEWTAYRATALYSDARLVEWTTRVYERTLQCYAELLSASFPGLTSHTVWHAAFPVRVYVHLYRRDREDPLGHVTEEMRWEPIEAGRSNEVVVEVGTRDQDFDRRRDAHRVRGLLRSLGRPDVSVGYSTSVLRLRATERMSEVTTRSVEFVRRDLRSILGFLSV